MKPIFTREERNRIYKRSLENYKENVRILKKEDCLKGLVGLCATVAYIISKDSDLDDRYLEVAEKAMVYSTMTHQEGMFPELEKHKPKETYVDGYWFPEEDYKIRIKILKQAIKETE